jgi:hypothetical protein
MAAPSATESRVGALLREWRQRRRMSQLDLARARLLLDRDHVSTAIEITTSDLTIESFYPADDHTGKVVRAIG